MGLLLLVVVLSVVDESVLLEAEHLKEALFNVFEVRVTGIRIVV